MGLFFNKLNEKQFPEGFFFFMCVRFMAYNIM